MNGLDLSRPTVDYKMNGKLEKFLSNRCIRNWRENRSNDGSNADSKVCQEVEKFAAERINEQRWNAPMKRDYLCHLLDK